MKVIIKNLKIICFCLFLCLFCPEKHLKSPFIRQSLGQNSAFFLSPKSHIKNLFSSLLRSFPSSIEPISGKLPDPQKPIVVIMDLHSTILKSTWPVELQYTYLEVTEDKNKRRMQKWVKSTSRGLWKRIKNLAQISGKSEQEVAKIVRRVQKNIHHYYTPEALPGVAEFIETMQKAHIPQIIVSGSERKLITRQLQEAGVMKYFRNEQIVGLNIDPFEKKQKRKLTKSDAIRSLKKFFPDTTLVFIDDWIPGIDATKECGGIVLSIPQGEGEEFNKSREQLIKAKTDYIIRDWGDWRAVLDNILAVVPEEVQQQITKKVPQAIKSPTDLTEELKVVLPAPRQENIPFHIEISYDIGSLSCSKVKNLDDSRIFLDDGTVNYSALTLQEIARIHSNHLNLNRPLISLEALDEETATKLAGYSKAKKCYFKYKGITVSWVQDTDYGVRPLNIGDIYFYKAIEDAGLLQNRSMETIIGIDGTEYVSSLVLARHEYLKNLFVVNPNLYSLRVTARNNGPYLEDKDTGVAYYWGSGIEAVTKKADLIIANFCSVILEKSAEELKNEIRNVLNSVISHNKLNPHNPQASILLGTSSLLSMEDIKKEFENEFNIELTGEPLHLPLDESSRKIIENQGYDITPDQTHYTIRAYRIKTKPGVLKTEAQEQRAEYEQEIFNDIEKLFKFFEPLLNGNDPEGQIEELFPHIYGLLFQEKEQINYDVQESKVPARPQMTFELVEQVLGRTIGRKLRCLEEGKQEVIDSAGNLVTFQDYPHLSETVFKQVADKMNNLKTKDYLMAYFRVALLYANMSKGGKPETRAKWMSDAVEKWEKELDLNVNNKASRMIAENLEVLDSGIAGLFENMEFLQKNPGNHKSQTLNEFFYRLIGLRGFPGHWERGEVSYVVFQETTNWIRNNMDELKKALDPENKMKESEVIDYITDIVYLFDFIDASSVREGLMTDDLNQKRQNFFADFKRVITRNAAGEFTTDWDTVFNEHYKNFDTIEGKVEYLKDRFTRFRGNIIEEGREKTDTLSKIIENEFYKSQEDFEGPDQLDQFIKYCNALKKFVDIMGSFQGGYVELATSCFTPETQIKIITLAIALAQQKGIIEMEEGSKIQPFNINFFKLMTSVAKGRNEFDWYKVGLIEAYLSDISLTDILLGNQELEKFDFDTNMGQASLIGAMNMEVEGKKAIMFDFYFSEEAADLLEVLQASESSKQHFHEAGIAEFLARCGIKEKEKIEIFSDIIIQKAFAGSVVGPVVWKVGREGDFTLLTLRSNKLQRSIPWNASAKDIIDLLESTEIAKGITFAFHLKNGEPLPKRPMPNSIVFENENLPTENLETILKTALISLALKGRLLLGEKLVNDLGKKGCLYLLRELAKELKIDIKEISVPFGIVVEKQTEIPAFIYNPQAENLANLKVRKIIQSSS